MCRINKAWDNTISDKTKYSAIHPIDKALSNTVYWLKAVYPLTHCGLATPHGDIDLGQHWRHQAIT